MRGGRVKLTGALLGAACLSVCIGYGAIAAAPAPAEDVPAGQALAADIERVLVVRLVPELNRQVAALRAELEKQLRRSVREAVEHALAARTPPTKEP